MAITRRFQAQVKVTPAEHSKLVTMKDRLLKQQVEILSETANPDGSVTVVLCGQGLGEWAVPVPPHADVEILHLEGKVNVMQAKRDDGIYRPAYGPLGASADTYQAVKLLTASQYARIESGEYTLPTGVTISSAVATSPAGTEFIVTFRGYGLGAFAQFQAIPCSLTIISGVVTFAASGVYAQPPSF